MCFPFISPQALSRHVDIPISINDACNLASDSLAAYFFFRAVNESALVLRSQEGYTNSTVQRMFSLRSEKQLLNFCTSEEDKVQHMPFFFFFFLIQFQFSQAPDGGRPHEGLVLTVLCPGLPPTSTLLTRPAPPARHPTDSS